MRLKIVGLVVLCALVFGAPATLAGKKAGKKAESDKAEQSEDKDDGEAKGASGKKKGEKSKLALNVSRVCWDPPENIM